VNFSKREEEKEFHIGKVRGAVEGGTWAAFTGERTMDGARRNIKRVGRGGFNVKRT